MKIGFIGLGNLGMPIAENILEKHPGMYVYNRTASKAIPLTQKGAVLCNNVKEIAGLCDIVFSIVADDAAIMHIVDGKEGLAAHLKPGGIHISISTILPATAKVLDGIHKKNNNHYIASPVMGRPEAAKSRKLNFLLSGDKMITEHIRPLLYDAGAAGIWEFGEEISAANTAKLCSNFLIVSAIEAMAEGVELAKKSGIDAQQWINMMMFVPFHIPVPASMSILFKRSVPRKR